MCQELCSIFRSEKVKDFDSFMECEDLNRFGRFSFNKFNKEVEVCLLKWSCVATLVICICLACDMYRIVHYTSM